MKSALKKKKKNSILSNRKKQKGKIGLLSIIVIFIASLAYILFSNIVLKNNSSNIFRNEPELLAAGKPIPAIAFPIILEAEHMSYQASPDGIQNISDTTASGASGKMLSINSTIVSSVTTETTISKIILTAKGMSCHGWPNAIVRIGETEVFNKKITSSSWNDFSTNFTLQPGSYNLSISYTNDYSSSSGSGCNRDLVIDKITLQ